MKRWFNQLLSCPLWDLRVPCGLLFILLLVPTLLAQSTSQPPSTAEGASNPSNSSTTDIAGQNPAPGQGSEAQDSKGALNRSSQGQVVPQATGVSTLGGVPGFLNGPAYVEVGGDDSHVSTGSAWNTLYIRGALSSTKNVINYEVNRETRFSDTGWFYAGDWTRVLNNSFYTDFSAGSSIGGSTIPKLRLDGIVHYKTLPRKQLVLGAGLGYDKSKTVNTATRGQFSGTYYFDRWPLIGEAGVRLTHANPGGVLARAQWLTVMEGHEKEHYISFRYEFGHDGYELIQTTANTAPTALFDFPINNYTVTWRQWIGLNWGVNLSFEHDGNPIYHRNGGLIGFFLDF